MKHLFYIPHFLISYTDYLWNKGYCCFPIYTMPLYHSASAMYPTMYLSIFSLKIILTSKLRFAFTKRSWCFPYISTLGEASLTADIQSHFPSAILIPCSRRSSCMIYTHTNLKPMVFSSLDNCMGLDFSFVFIFCI